MTTRLPGQLSPLQNGGAARCVNHGERLANWQMQVDELGVETANLCDECARNVTSRQQLSRSGEVTAEVECELCKSKEGVVAFKLPDEANPITGWACTACRARIYDEHYKDLE
jgi:DNA-directed RNA polymerase subunit RPC12/RpoP